MPTLVRIALLVIALSAFTFAQNSSVTQPPIAGLSAVVHPDISSSEKDVRDLIIKTRSELDSVIGQKKLGNELAAAYGKMGRVYHAYEFLDEALICYQNASALTPREFQWIYLRAKALQEKNDWSTAAEVFESASKLRPDYAPSYENLGSLFLEQNLSGLAEKNFIKALQLNNRSAFSHYSIGRINYQRKNYPKAIESFNNALKLAPGANQIHYSLALAYRNDKQPDKARFHLEKKGDVGVKPSDPVYSSSLDFGTGVILALRNGKKAIEARRFEDAAKLFAQVLEKDPKNISALVNLGVAYINLGKGNEAIEQFAKAVQVDPRNTNARYNLAFLLRRKGDALGAISNYRVILQQNPKDTEARLSMAQIILRLQFYVEALSEFSKLYAVEPNKEQVVVGYAQANAAVGNEKRAKEVLTKSFEDFPDRKRTKGELSFLLSSANDKSLRDGENSVKLARQLYTTETNTTNLLLLTNALAESGKCSEARSLLRFRIEKLTDPKLATTKKILEQRLTAYGNGETCRP